MHLVLHYVLQIITVHLDQPQKRDKLDLEIVQPVFVYAPRERVIKVGLDPKTIVPAVKALRLHVP